MPKLAKQKLTHPETIPKLALADCVIRLVDVDSVVNGTSVKEGIREVEPETMVVAVNEELENPVDAITEIIVCVVGSIMGVLLPVP